MRLGPHWQIITALAMALLPVLNVFLILFLLISVCEPPVRPRPARPQHPQLARLPDSFPRR